MESRDDMTVDGVGNGNGVGVHGGQRGSQRVRGRGRVGVWDDDCIYGGGRQGEGEREGA